MQPDLRFNPPRTNAPARGEWRMTADQQNGEGKLYHLHGNAQIEGATILFSADDIDYDEDTGDLHATGHVYYHNFPANEQIWCDRLDYNTDSQTGKFYKVHGQTQPRINAKPGMLTTTNPFYFEGDWAERIGEKYIVHDGFITNCKIPSPWWTLHGPRFDIIPDEKAVAYRPIFRLKGVPLFFFPYFFKSLKREPRKSGFLMPNFGNSSIAGIMLGVGYFWAINRSYDVTYNFTDYTTNGTANNVQIRGKPKAGTDFDAIFYDVQDHGLAAGAAPGEYSGFSLYALGRADLGNGWTARGAVNYISSFDFQQFWSQSFSTAIGSEIQSVGFLNKNWSDYTFNVVAARLENFQQGEVPVLNPLTGVANYETDAVVIRKLPEVELNRRETQISSKIPVWYSFDSSAGLLYRQEPLFTPGNVLVDTYQTGQLMNRVDFSPHLMTSLSWHHFHLVPRFGLDETYYAESQTPNVNASQQLNTDAFQVISTSLMRSAQDFSADLIFPSLARVFNKKTFLGDKLKHVIEPRASYHWVGGIGQDFNNFIRFDTTDILSNTDDVQFSLANRLYAKRGDQVLEIFTWQLWEAYFFDPTFGGAIIPGTRNVLLAAAELTPYAFLVGPRNYSPVVSAMNVTPIPQLSLNWEADYDPLVKRVVDNTIAVDYHWSNYFASVGQNLVNTNPILTSAADQFRFRVGFGNPNKRGWNAGVDAVYDFHLNLLQYATTQITYNTDCCGLSLQWRRFSFGIRNENQYRVAFSISNIGSFGTLRKQDRLF